MEQWLEWFSRNKARVDITSATAAGAGLCMMGIVLLKVSILDRVDPVHWSGIARLVFITMMAYLVAGLVINWFWSKPLRRRIPSWVMIALLGAWLVVVSAGVFRFYTNALASNVTATMFMTISSFILDKAKDGLGVFVVLSLLTLPITASVHHAGRIFRGVKCWHDGEESPSILSE